MGDKNRKTYARASVVLEVSVGLSQAWDGECTLDQVLKQGSRDGVEILKKAIDETPNIVLVGIKRVEVKLVFEDVDR